jgi:hypothetical protein
MQIRNKSSFSRQAGDGCKFNHIKAPDDKLGDLKPGARGRSFARATSEGSGSNGSQKSKSSERAGFSSAGKDQGQVLFKVRQMRSLRTNAMLLSASS